MEIMVKKKSTPKAKNKPEKKKMPQPKQNNKIIPVLFGILAIIILVAAVPYIKNFIENKNSISVYFVKTYTTAQYKLMPVKRAPSEDETRISVAINALLNGPNKKEIKQGYFTEIPKNTKLLALKETDDKITINLSRDYEIGGGSESMTFRLEQLINTAIDNAEGKPVYLEIEGQQIKYIGGEGIIVPQPLSKNINKPAGN